MEKFLRSWRQDALNRSQNETAIYVGDKVLALTNSDADAFWLAQVHFSNNNYTRALALLSRKDLISRSTSCRYLAAHCYLKQNKFDAALSILGEQNPTHLIHSAGQNRRKIQHLNGHSHVTLRNGKSAASKAERLERSEEQDREEGNNLRFEAAMCYLRGLCYAKQNAFDRARDCYKDAVRIDVQCFEAFDQLMKNSLMSPAEELEFLESLDFDSISVPSDPSASQEAAHFVKMLYTTRLSKYTSPATLSDATETLSTHYNLATNPDILLSRAEALYTQCRFAEALELTSSILTTPETGAIVTSSPRVPSQNLGHSPTVYPLHLACLYETRAINALFLLAHTLADNAPEESYTYLAIGVYYLSVAKIAEARRFFSKASLLDPHSAPAWIGFAHTFAAEGEHDQAIAAYSTAARLFQGSHLPQLFLGMQHLALNNMSLAHEYLCAAYSMSSGSPSGEAVAIPSAFSNGLPSLGGDPLVLNELGVVLYHQAQLEDAVGLFRQALALAEALQCDPGAWVATRANLGHALRRMGNLDEALAEFDECLRVGAGGGSTGYSTTIGGVPTTSVGVAGYEDRGLIGSLQTSRGLIYLQQGRTLEAVTVLHEAVRVLGVSGGEAAGGAGIAGTILSRALELWTLEGRGRNDPFGAGRGKDRAGTRYREEVGAGESWTDNVVDSGTFEEAVEVELDTQAKDLLGNALSRVRPRRAHRQQQQQQQQQPQPQVSETALPEEMELEEPPEHRTRGGSRPVNSRRSPTRRVQTRHPGGG